MCVVSACVCPSTAKGVRIEHLFRPHKRCLDSEMFWPFNSESISFKELRIYSAKAGGELIVQEDPFFFLPSFLDIFKWASVCFLFMKPLMLPLPLNTHVFFFPFCRMILGHYVQYRTSTASQKYIGLRIRVRHRGLYVSMCLVEWMLVATPGAVYVVCYSGMYVHYIYIYKETHKRPIHLLNVWGFLFLIELDG